MADAVCPPDLRAAAQLAAAALAELDRVGTRIGADGRRRIVDAVSERLAELATDPAGTDGRRRVLLAWRDRLGSYVLAASALDELDVHADAADQFLRRGLEELLAATTAAELAAG